ncbi:response regulator transcription factor [Methylobacillus caricis]|uniref:response regulator transcription factor n=1 Tax=Methylobacillus caricis TaxID=1971611 RepID=UPI001CFF7D35|nr:response regulator transcription factor [Methylobacillus caricis]MCB5188516.1 response regulator transcription factor [Methylobacillus caricis]
MNTALASEDYPDLLLVDDDELFTQVLAKAMQKRGFNVTVAHNVSDAIAMTAEEAPEYAVIDLKMPGDSGLTLVKHLNQIDSQTRIVVLTGYASIATAVEAVKLGATHYLAKPADADQILAAFERTEGDINTPVPSNALSVNRLEWEHIQRVLQENEGNISATARSLNMHRRTLQRKLNKYPAKK